MTDRSANDTGARRRTLSIQGQEISYVESGRPSAPTLVLLHGWPQSSASFARVQRELGDSVHAFAVDLPGIGGSHTAPPAGDKRSLAAMMHQVIEAGAGRDP